MEEVLLDKELTEEELIEMYGPIPEDLPIEPLEHTIEEANENNIDTELEVDTDETSDKDIQA